MKRFAALALVAVPMLAACEQVATSCPPVPTANVITVPEDYGYPFDAKPGDRLDVILIPEGDTQSRCNDMGGILVVQFDRNLWTCQGVDF